MSRSIIFVCYNLHERPAKVAAALNLLGEKPILITISPALYSGWQSFFSQHLVTTIDKISDVIRSFDNPVVHHFTKNVDGLTLELLIKEISFIYDYKDIFPGAVKGLEESSELQAQMSILDAMIAREIRFSYKDGQFDRYLKFRGIEPSKKGFYLPDMVWPNSPITSGSPQIGHPEKCLRVAFIGNWSIEKIEPEHAGFGILGVIKSIVKQGLSFDLFPFRHDYADQDRDKMQDYLSLSSEFPSFRIRQRVEADSLPGALHESGWGSFITSRYHFKELQDLGYMFEPQYGLPGRISDYLGAGLPILVDEEVPEPNLWIKAYGIGLSVPRGGIHRLRESIENSDYAKLIRNIEFFCKEKLDPKTWANKLLNLYYN